MTDVLTPSPTLHSLTLEQPRDHLQAFGYRAETVKDPAGQTLLRSATAGMGFDIRMGSKLPGSVAGNQRPERELPSETQAQVPMDAHTDFTFLVTFAVKGTLPQDRLSTLLNSWNNAYRFARLRFDQNLLILDMDVSVAGGVSRNHLRAAFATWDQLIASLIPYLRHELARQNGSAAKIAAEIVPEPAPANADASESANESIRGREGRAPVTADHASDAKTPDPLAALANSEPATTPAIPFAATPATTPAAPKSNAFRAAPRPASLLAPKPSNAATRTEAAKAVAQALQITPPENEPAGERAAANFQI